MPPTSTASRDQEQLADRFATLSGMDKVFFCNSGCEANEAAIKLARMYGHRRASRSRPSSSWRRPSTAARMATLSATGSRKVQAGFEPLLHRFLRVSV